MKKNQHVTPHPAGGWQVKGDNNSRATARTKTQSDNHSEVVIHRTNGRIRDKNSYGNDPFPPKG